MNIKSKMRRRTCRARHKNNEGGSERWMECSWKRVNDSRQRWREGGGGGGPLQLNHHIFSLVRDIIYTNPLKGQEHSMWCQLQQPIHFLFLFLFLSVSLSFCRRLCRSASRSIPSFPSIFIGHTPVTVDFRLGDACACPCVLFKDCMSLSNLGFHSMWLAGSGVPLMFQCLASPSSLWSQHKERRGRKG